MRKTNYTVLLTGTINSTLFDNHNSGNIITNIEERIKQYEESLTKYISDSVFDNIVFAENSGYPLQINYYEGLADSLGKKFEFISCPTPNLANIKNVKSYGEALIIKYAIDNSNLLRECESFYKCTGRIFLRNSKQIVLTNHLHKNEFITIKSDGWCYTNVFKMSVEDYNKYFREVHKMINENGFDIEHNFYSIIDNSPNLDVGSFLFWPQMTGVHGTTGQRYSCSWKGKIYHDLLLWIGAYKYGTSTSKYGIF